DGRTPRRCGPRRRYCASKRAVPAPPAGPGADGTGGPMARQDTMTAADAAEPTAGGTARRLAHRLRGLGAARLTALTAVLAGVVVIVTLSLTGTGGGGPHRVPPTPAQHLSLGALGHPGQRITRRSPAGRPVLG